MWIPIEQAPRDGLAPILGCVLEINIRGNSYWAYPITVQLSPMGEWQDLKGEPVYVTHFRPLPPVDEPETVELLAERCTPEAVEAWWLRNYDNLHGMNGPDKVLAFIEHAKEASSVAKD